MKSTVKIKKADNGYIIDVIEETYDGGNTKTYIASNDEKLADRIGCIAMNVYNSKNYYGNDDEIELIIE